MSKFENHLTITSEFLEDQNKIYKSKNYTEFIKKYGHLRAGTYDINSKCYSELDKKVFINNKKNKLNIKQKKFRFKKNTINKINILIKKNKLNLKTEELLDYFKKSISSREYAKFIFTKSINVILQNIKIFAKINKITLNDIEQLSIKDIIKHKNKNTKKLHKIIKKNKLLSKFDRHINLPEIIVEKSNAYVGALVVYPILFRMKLLTWIQFTLRKEKNRYNKRL